ncbi:uncharacterized protein LOC144624721 [Crassostrea virginica]
MLPKTGFVFVTGIAITLTYDDLSFQKNATQSTEAWYYDLYKADNAVDRNITTCMRTEPIGGASPDKTVWWKVDLGGVHNIYSVNILFRSYDEYESRQRGRFAGFSLYISNSGDTSNLDNSSLCYKDGPQLPPLNFTTNCIKSGRYVIFYNERLDNVGYPASFVTLNVYTELCEVQVNGCVRSDVYGSNCNESCPTNCKYNTCDIENGTCVSCEAGWRGRTCNTKCSDGLYGVNCTQQCSGHCRDNTVCDHVTGRCDMGCATGWSGSLCNKICEDWTFGNDCINNCSGNCLDDSPCNKQTGYCEGGCKPGYTNALCNKRCVQSFGEGCRYPCSKHCLNKTCNESNGNCLYGCEMGFYGDKCDKDICSHLKTEQNPMSSVWIYIGAVCFGINILVVIIFIVCLWGLYTNRLSISIKTRSCAKSEHYAEAVVTPDDNSHYQELSVSGGGNPYLNTTFN